MGLIEFYNSLSKVKFDETIYWNALESTEFKCYDQSRDFQLLDSMEDAKFKTFLFHNPESYIVPLKNFDREMFGFVCRSVKKKAFHSVVIDKKYPQVFGMENFRGFKINDPILLTEGIKDCMTLRKLYPFSLAYLTSEPSEILFEFIKQISNRIIIFADNDTAGRKLLKKSEYEHYKIYTSPFGKDLGEYWNNKPEILDWLKMNLMKEGVI